MLFSNPDYPLFLIAVFLLYALSRSGGVKGRAARIALMVLLGDLVFVLIAKNADALWDPLGNVVYRMIAGPHRAEVVEVIRRVAAERFAHVPRVPLAAGWPIATLAWHWAVGLAVLGGGVLAGLRGAAWLASDRGQRRVARGMVVAILAVAATVAIAHRNGVLDDVSDCFARAGHLLVLAILGVGLGAAQGDAHRPLGRVVILFVASSLFYQAWAVAMPGPYRYLLALLLGTIVLDYYLAIWIENADSDAKRRALVIVSLCSNLGILFFFKYTDFVADDVLHLGVPRLNLILPAGISFHTFQSLSYTIDVYRGELRATRSPIKFATFVLFFPQLVAGPIVRAQDLLPQLEQLPALQLEKATDGLYRIVVGLFKKIALADTLAIAIVERVFDDPTHFSSLEVLAGVYGYALQIYLDFSAYSDIAIGSAQVLGFDLPENFRTPYRSANLQEFWRRWHISLSTWLRDYLYITLGGSRGAPWRTYANLAMTMLLGGLWHGASWTFIVWGALHGFGLAITRFFQRSTATMATIAWCATIAVLGAGALELATLAEISTWPRLVIVWLAFTPLWAVATAWLGRDEQPKTAGRAVASWREAAARLPNVFRLRRNGPIPTATVVSPGLDRVLGAELLRFAMCGAALGFFAALQWGETWTWIPLAVIVAALAVAADCVEDNVPALVVVARAAGLACLGALPLVPSWTWIPLALAVMALLVAASWIEHDLAGLVARARRALSVFLVFQYVCLAWVFFRATSFDNALAVLRQIALRETDHANLVPLVTCALAVGFLCHFFANGTFRWLRDRFVALPPWAQGAVLAAAALVLRELGHAKLVKFIYFQF